MIDYKSIDCPPQISLLNGLLKNGRIDAICNYLKLYPGDYSSTYIDGQSMWSILFLTKSGIGTGRNSITPYSDFNNHDFPTRYPTIDAENAKMLNEEAISSMLSSFGNPWTTPPFNDALTVLYNDRQSKEIEISKNRRLTPNLTVYKKLINPSIAHSAALFILFYRQPGLEVNDLLHPLANKILDLPEAAPTLQSWLANDGIHPVLHAIEWNDTQLIKKYLDLGLDPNSTLISIFGPTPLRNSLLSFCTHVDSAVTLLSNGADKSINFFQNQKKDIQEVWRDTFISKPSHRPESLYSHPSTFFSALSKSSNGIDKNAAISQLIQSTLDGTTGELSKSLKRVGVEFLFASKDNPQAGTPTTAFAHFLSLDFQTKSLSTYKQANYILKNHVLPKQILLSKINDTETYAAHIINNFHPPKNHNKSINKQYAELNQLINSDPDFSKILLKTHVVTPRDVDIFLETVSSFNCDSFIPHIYTEIETPTSFYSSYVPEGFANKLFDLSIETLNIKSEKTGIPLKESLFGMYNKIISKNNLACGIMIPAITREISTLKTKEDVISLSQNTQNAILHHICSYRSLISKQSFCDSKHLLIFETIISSADLTENQLYKVKLFAKTVGTEFENNLDNILLKKSMNFNKPIKKSNSL